MMYKLVRVLMIALAVILFFVSSTSIAVADSNTSPPIEEEERVAPQNLIDPGGGGGGVAFGYLTFSIGHACTYTIIGARPWITGRAYHWGPQGYHRTVTFWHQQGYEVANFGRVPFGHSHGQARITIGFGTCRACSTGIMNYFVHSPHVLPVNIVRMTLSPR